METFPYFSTCFLILNCILIWSLQSGIYNGIYSKTLPIISVQYRKLMNNFTISIMARDFLALS